MSTTTRPRWAARAANPAAPLWVRVAAYAEGRAGPNGHAPLTAGELRAAIDPTITTGSYSRAITSAVKAGWLSPTSSARCLVLAGAEQQECHAIHRPQP